MTRASDDPFWKLAPHPNDVILRTLILTFAKRSFMLLPNWVLLGFGLRLSLCIGCLGIG